MEIELKPCPFCGGEAFYKTLATKHDNEAVELISTIECKSCSVRLPKLYAVSMELCDNGQIKYINDERIKAADFWNGRKQGD